LRPIMKTLPETENLPEQNDTVDERPLWQTPEMTVETVAEITRNGATLRFLDGNSGS